MTTKFLKKISFIGELAGGSYLNGIPVVKYLTQAGEISIDNDVTIFVGENGTGKSTLLEAIAVACGFNPEGGSRNFTFATAETHSELCKHIMVSRHTIPKDGFFLRAESFYNVATNIDELDSQPAAAAPIINSYGGVSLHNQSHGESFLALVKNRFGGNGLYILDEPEAALSPMRLLTLIRLMKDLIDNGSQFIISTHSPILMAFPGAQILELSERGIKPTCYQDTEHYQVTKRFLDNPEKMLLYLLE
ncbi:MAG: AAA family ATPase [Clostridia bacterium]|nr:AAA family ATPase [Clostridia bacterium]